MPVNNNSPPLPIPTGGFECCSREQARKPLHKALVVRLATLGVLLKSGLDGIDSKFPPRLICENCKFARIDPVSGRAVRRSHAPLSIDTGLLCLSTRNFHRQSSLRPAEYLLFSGQQ